MHRAPSEGARHGLNVEAPQEGGDLIEGSLGCAQADALQRAQRSEPAAGRARRLMSPPAQRFEPLQAERQVRTTLGTHERVDLIDDHGLDAREPISRLAGEQEVERLGGGDEDLRRPARQLRALFGRGVTGAHAYGGHVMRHPVTLGLGSHAGEGRPQVALHVDPERFERRDVEHPHARLGWFGLNEHQAVEGHEERRQGLAGPRGRQEQGGHPGGNAGPRLRLRLRRSGKRSGEPALGARVGELERVHPNVLREGCDTVTLGP